MLSKSASTFLLSLGLGAMALVGCDMDAFDTPPPATIDPGGGGKGDGSGDDPVGDCEALYVDWLDNVYVPLVEDGPIDAERWRRLEAAAASPVCGGWSRFEGALGEAYLAWHTRFLELVVTPYVDRYESAFAAYSLEGGLDAANYARFLDRTRVPDETRTLAAALDLVRPPTTSALDFGISWLPTYGAGIALVTRELPREVGGVIGAGETLWQLNAHEGGFLWLLEEARPDAFEDGTFGRWADEYGALMYFGPQPDGSGSFDETDEFAGCRDVHGRVGSVCARRQIIERFATTAPEAVGDSDSHVWMSLLSDALPAATTRALTYVSQLAFVERARPNELVGEAAYLMWLELFEDLHADATVREAHLLHSKPCVTSPRALAAFAEFIARRPDVASSVLEQAAPLACGER
jgi:hypothetical protein